jgi:hypothetical protein
MVCGHYEGAQHDCSYVDERNRLIPAAEAQADRLAAQDPERWEVEFLKAMDRLWRARGGGYAAVDSAPLRLRVQGKAVDA